MVSGEVSSALLALFPVFAFPAALLPLLPPQPASRPSSITDVSVIADALAFICLLLAMNETLLKIVNLSYHREMPANTLSKSSLLQENGYISGLNDRGDPLPL
ncbi:hypothetical protein D3C74_462090 [compost metagenome]